MEIDIGTVVAAATSSLGLSLAGAYWLGRTLIQHRLTAALELHKLELARELEGHKQALGKDLERTKGQIQLELGRDKAATEGSIKREVEAQLGQLAAQRQYEYEAKRRLYQAIGPLRFQLLLACRDYAGRIESWMRKEHYEISLSSYYGRSTLYRLLRPLAISELIERQVGIADFAIDPHAVDCLRFRRSITKIWSGDELVIGRTDVNWNSQIDHVFADSLRNCAQALIETDAKGIERLLRFDEFNAQLQQEGAEFVQPFDRILEGFSIGQRPILWLRLVAYGAACNELIIKLGEGLGFELHQYPTTELLHCGYDKSSAQDISDICQKIQALHLVSL